jgi:hypothetical protein
VLSNKLRKQKDEAENPCLPSGRLSKSRQNKIKKQTKSKLQPKNLA